MNDRSNMSKMGKHIAKLRKSKGYTQKTLGDILDVSDKTISKWEKGVIAPDITLLNSLAKTLDISVEELLTGEEVKNTNTVEAIDMYSKITKRKLIKSFVIFTFIFILCTFFVFRIEEYYSWHLTNIKSVNNVYSKGYIISNNKESKIVINEIGVDNNTNFHIKSIKIELKNNDEIIYQEQMDFEETILLREVLNKRVISVSYYEKIDKDNLELEILYIDLDGKEKILTINY